MIAQAAGPTDRWTQLRPHVDQDRLWRTAARFVAVAAGRGSGKTELARRYIVRHLPVVKPWPALYFYALPTYNQARKVAWKELKALIPRRWLKKPPSETLLEIETIFGSTLMVVGMDRPERIEGLQYDGCVIDESSDQKPGVFDLSVAPALTHRDPFCWRIGVPKRFGRGAKEFKQFCLKQAQEYYTWKSSSVLTPKQLAYFRKTLSPVDFREQFEASWEDAAGKIFHAFSQRNISRKVKYRSERRIFVGCDFNVDPMCWTLSHCYDDTMAVFDEVFIRNTNTQATLNELFRKYGGHEAGWYFIGDASANARKTSASETDVRIIKNDKRFKSKQVHFPGQNPAVVDRFAACNALLCNADGDVHFFVHPKCERVIADLEDRQWKKEKREPDDGPDMGHMSDAFGYIIVKQYPIVTSGLAGLYATGV